MGKAMGTPAYMSPEQAAGRWDELGPATDVYGLGATLYVILTGQAPFEGDHTSILKAVCQARMERGTLRLLQGEFSAAFEDAQLARELAERFQQQSDTAADSHRLLALVWLLEAKVQQMLGNHQQALESLDTAQHWIDLALTINPHGPPQLIEAAAELEALRQILD